MKLFNWFKANPTSVTAKTAPLAIALEPRMMFDAAIAATMADAEAATEPTNDDSSTFDHAATPQGTSAPRQELVVIDSQIVNYQEILTELKPGTEVLLLDADQDGLKQIADYLQDRSALDAIHILSHGSAGSLHLGNLVLTTDNLATHAERLSQLGSRLAAEGDILLYGCNLAGSQDGLNLLSGMAAVTQADLSASRNATGSAARGGDWVLEQQHGTIEAQSLSLATIPY